MPLPPHRAIVIVDSNAAIRTLLARALYQYFPSHPVYACPTPADVLAFLVHTLAACIVTDAVSEVADAAFVHAVQANWSNLPMVLMTAFGPYTPLTQDVTPYVAVLFKPMSMRILCDTLCCYLTDDSDALSAP